MKTLLKAILPFLVGIAYAQTPPVPVYGPIGSSGGGFALINSPSVIFPSDADHTMTYPEMSGSGGFLRVTCSTTLTTTRNLIAPQAKGFGWVIENACTQPIIIKPPSGSGVTIPVGSFVTVASDGYNYGQAGGRCTSGCTFTGGISFNMTNCPGNVCFGNTGTYTVPPSSSGNGEQDYQSHYLTFSGPGTNLGNSGGWSTSKAHVETDNFLRRGISQHMNANILCGSPSDCAAWYVYMYSRGAYSAQSDEGDTLASLKFAEGGTQPAGGLRPFNAQILVGGLGNRSPTFQNILYDGVVEESPLLDITQGTASGTMQITGTNFGTSYLSTMSVTCTTGCVSGGIPLSTAWGTLTAPISNPGVTAPTITTTTMTLNLTAGGISSPAPLAVGFACIAGPWYPQQTYISSINGYTSGSSETITFEVRYPNGDETHLPIILQGGVCGQYLSFDQDYTFTGGYRTSYFAFGSQDGTHLIYGENSGGNIIGNTRPQPGVNAVIMTSGTAIAYT